MKNKVDYDSLAAQLTALTEDVPYEIANLSNASALLWEHLPDINWAGFYKMMDGKVEALEFKLNDSSELFGIPIKEMKIKSGVLIAAIRRGASIILPRGADSILVGDSVIVITKNLPISKLKDIMK